MRPPALQAPRSQLPLALQRSCELVVYGAYEAQLQVFHMLNPPWKAHNDIQPLTQRPSLQHKLNFKEGKNEASAARKGKKALGKLSKASESCVLTVCGCVCACYICVSSVKLAMYSQHHMDMCIAY